MKKNKYFIAAIALIIALTAVLVSACVEEDTQIDDALKLASQGDFLKVEVSDDSGVFYIYDNGKVTDTYGLGIRFEDVVGGKDKAIAFTSVNLKEGYVCDRNRSSGKVSLSAELINTGDLGIDGAKLILEANTVTKEVTVYQISYTDANGYKVKITLA